MYDLQSNGAVAFGDFLRPIENPELLKIALLYAQRFDGLILVLLSRKNWRLWCSPRRNHEYSIGAIRIPSLSETIQIQRDLEILRYTGGALPVYPLQRV